LPSAFEDVTLSKGSLTLAQAIEIDEAGTLSGNGTLITDLTNNGIVSPGDSIGTLTISGNYTQTSSATFYAEAGGGTSDTLVVTGAADIQGGGIVLTADGYLTSGSYEILTSGTLMGNGFDTVTAPAIFATTLSGFQEALSLEVTRATYESLGTTANQASLGAALDRSWPVASGDMADILNAMDNMMDLSSVCAALYDLGPWFHSAVTAAAVDNALTRTDRVRQHLYEVQLDHPERSETRDGEANVPWQFWAAGTLMDRRYDATSQSPAVRDRLDSMLFGLDRSMGRRVTLGFAGGYSRADIHDRSAASQGRVDSFTGYVYSALNLAGFHGQAVAGLGRNQYEADRAVTFLNRTASSEHRGWQASVLLGAGYDWTPGNWTFGPIASLQYLHLEERGFMEEGADAADLWLGPEGARAWVSSLGVRAGHSMLLNKKIRITPSIRAEWIHALSKDTGRLDTTFVSTGQRFGSSPGDQKEDTFELALSLTADLTPKVKARIRYLHQAQGDGGYTTHQAGAEMRVLF